MEVLFDPGKALSRLYQVTRLALILSVSLPGLSGDVYAEEPDVVQDADDAPYAPYVVLVAQPDAHARCGPGIEHYRTDPLKQGQELEVYVETDDGWLGIRPPEKSFCWIPATSAEIAGDGATATISEEGTVAWIGTQLGRARRYRWQVQLEVGEEVTVVGTTNREGKAGAETWYRIAPPSGEFRWVHQDQVVESPEKLVSFLQQQMIAKAAEPTVQPATHENDVAANTRQEKTNSDTDATDENDLGKSVLSSSNSSRRGEATGRLQVAAEVPDLMPLEQPPAPGRVPADRPFEILRNADAQEFQDRGAVIGSGLRQPWRQESQFAESTADDPTEQENVSPVSGAAAAAAAITEPLRKVSDVVANFISPPRFVAIDQNQMQQPGMSDLDRRWIVGSSRTSTSNIPIHPPASLSMGDQSMPPQVLNPTRYGGVIPASTTGASLGRVVTTDQISRVEDAVTGADVEAVGRILSRLMADGASADEMHPLIRRIEELLASGDPTRTTRIRELLQRATGYRNLAVRRDGATTIQSAPPSSFTASPPANTQSNAAQSIAAQPRSVQPSTLGEPIVTEQPKSKMTTGYLVQVYSSRPNSPPYALTDDSGLTIAYITPYPGVNLRPHLNSRIAVTGNEKLLQGMNMPHILADRVLRR